MDGVDVVKTAHTALNLISTPPPATTGNLPTTTDLTAFLEAIQNYP